jgi:hypothetical protein
VRGQVSTTPTTKKVDKIDFLKMAVSSEECTADIHATSSDPHVVYGDFSSFCDQMKVNEGIFPGDIPVNVDNTNIQFGDYFLKFSFILFKSRSLHEAICQISRRHYGIDPESMGGASYRFRIKPGMTEVALNPEVRSNDIASPMGGLLPRSESSLNRYT